MAESKRRYAGLFHPVGRPPDPIPAPAATPHVPSINQRVVRNFVAHAQTHNRIVECESMWDAKRAADRRRDGGAPAADPARRGAGAACVDAFQESRAAEAARREAAKRQLGHLAWDATPAAPSAAGAASAAAARDAPTAARQRARDETGRRSGKDKRTRRRRERSESSSDSSADGARRRRKERKKDSRRALERADTASGAPRKRSARESEGVGAAVKAELTTETQPDRE